MIPIRWTVQAADDLDAIHTFITRDSSHYARLVIERLLQAVEQVVEYPDSGRVVPELADPTIRELVRRPYRIVYRRRPDLIEVLTVFHAFRTLPDLDPKRDAG